MQGKRLRAWRALLLCGFVWFGFAWGGAVGAEGPIGGNAPLVLGAAVSDVGWNPAYLDRYPTLIGRMPTFIGWYQDWATDTFQPGVMDSIAARGAMPMVTWEPFDRNRGRAPDERYALRTIAAGDHDAAIRAYARAAAAWQRPFFLRFAQEMNGDWMPWSSGVVGNTPADFVAAWRHLHDLFAAEGATNVRWVWSPNITFPTLPPMASFYPGDDYVDWLALDGYNRGTGLYGPGWVSLADTFNASYATITELAPKPILIAETASSEFGGDKAAWIRQGFLHDLPARFPRIRAVVWFDFDFSTKSETDWRIDSSPASLAAYRDIAASPLYQGQLT